MMASNRVLELHQKVLRSAVERNLLFVKAGEAQQKVMKKQSDAINHTVSAVDAFTKSLSKRQKSIGALFTSNKLRMEATKKQQQAMELQMKVLEKAVDGGDKNASKELGKAKSTTKQGKIMQQSL